IVLSRIRVSAALEGGVSRGWCIWGAAVQLAKIITLADRNHLTRFLAMERSLRAIGCTLPLMVIPYSDDLFELPANASWWKVPELHDWLGKNCNMGNRKKFQVFLEKDYLYVDTDVCFLRDPTEVLSPHDGLVTASNSFSNGWWEWIFKGTATDI